MKPLRFLGVGRSRAVFLMPSGRWVLKVPISDEGYWHNQLEATKSKTDDWLYKWQKAKAKILKSGLLVMEYVTHVPVGQQPDWASYVDCGQVGLTHDGRIVAYDYAES